MSKVRYVALAFALLSGSSVAADYTIDGTGAGMHSSVQFKTSHMGISSLWGRFNDITGSFSYDADDIEASQIKVNINPASLDSNHQQRDEHLVSDDFLAVTTYPDASFVSRSFTDKGNGMATVVGDFNLHGVSKEISIDFVLTGEGETPFGDYRVGFEGSTELSLTDFGMNPATIEIIVAIEGVKQ